MSLGILEQTYSKLIGKHLNETRYLHFKGLFSGGPVDNLSHPICFSKNRGCAAFTQLEKPHMGFFNALLHIRSHFLLLPLPALKYEGCALFYEGLKEHVNQYLV